MKHYHANHQNADDIPLITNEFQSEKKLTLNFRNVNKTLWANRNYSVYIYE